MSYTTQTKEFDPTAPRQSNPSIDLQRIIPLYVSMSVKKEKQTLYMETYGEFAPSLGARRHIPQSQNASLDTKHGLLSQQSRRGNARPPLSTTCPALFYEDSPTDPTESTFGEATMRDVSVTLVSNQTALEQSNLSSATSFHEHSHSLRTLIQPR
jgi:hypothetical protein